MKENKSPEENIKYLKQLTDAISKETSPIKGHTDPTAINDCWNEVRDTLQELESQFTPSKDAEEAIVKGLAANPCPLPNPKQLPINIEEIISKLPADKYTISPPVDGINGNLWGVITNECSYFAPTLTEVLIKCLN